MVAEPWGLLALHHDMADQDSACFVSPARAAVGKCSGRTVGG
jgi:hypothetical protein